MCMLIYNGVGRIRHATRSFRQVSPYPCCFGLGEDHREVARAWSIYGDSEENSPRIRTTRPCLRLFVPRQNSSDWNHAQGATILEHLPPPLCTTTTPSILQHNNDAVGRTSLWIVHTGTICLTCRAIASAGSREPSDAEKVETRS